MKHCDTGVGARVFSVTHKQGEPAGCRISREASRRRDPDHIYSQLVTGSDGQAGWVASVPTPIGSITQPKIHVKHLYESNTQGYPVWLKYIEKQGDFGSLKIIKNEKEYFGDFGKQCGGASRGERRRC